MLEISCIVNPGNSGGPLLDTQGTAVGMVTLKSANTAEPAAYAIPAKTLREFVISAFADAAPGMGQEIDGDLTWQKIDEVRAPSVVMVIALR